jgi:hypothetical protein
MTKIITIRAHPTRGADTVTVDYNRPPSPSITVTVSQEQAWSLYRRIVTSKNWHAAPSLALGGLWNAGKEM